MALKARLAGMLAVLLLAGAAIYVIQQPGLFSEKKTPRARPYIAHVFWQPPRRTEGNPVVVTVKVDGKPKVSGRLLYVSDFLEEYLLTPGQKLEVSADSGRLGNVWTRISSPTEGVIKEDLAPPNPAYCVYLVP